MAVICVGLLEKMDTLGSHVFVFLERGWTIHDFGFMQDEILLSFHQSFELHIFVARVVQFLYERVDQLFTCREEKSKLINETLLLR